MDVSEEVGCELVVAGCEATAVLEAAEHPLDGVAALVEGFAEAAFPAPVALGRDVGDRALLFDQVADSVAVISPVGVDETAWPQSDQQMLGRLAVGGLARCQQEGERSALTVGNGMDLGVASAPADPDRLGLRPPFPPAAERCAFTCVLSISTSAGGPPAAANVSNTARHTPFAVHRTCGCRAFWADRRSPEHPSSGTATGARARSR